MVICPYCYGEQLNRKQIVDYLEINGEKCISQIESDLGINRGTLKHHINHLIRNNILKKERKTHLAGKPSMISVSFVKLNRRSQHTRNE